MERLLNVAEWFDRPPRAVGKIGSWFILPLIAVIMFDVITRKIDFFRLALAEANIAWFNPNIFQDSEWHMHAILLFSSFGFGYLMNSHVRVDIFRERLVRRKQAWVELFGLTLLAIPYLLLITYFAFIFVSMSFHQGEGSESMTGIGMRYIIKSVMVIGFLMLLSAFIATWLRLVAFQFGSDEVRRKAAGVITIFAHQDEEPMHEDVTPGNESNGGGASNA
jgi:TRAP-type mannitol/chloroaromatic compound transport system permease small subunit